MAAVFPHINFRREVTIGHLMLDIDAPTGNLAKVNPPIRPREDVEVLWQNILEGNIDWICSDHACCKHEMKVDQEEPGNVWLAKSGFGGSEYMLSAFCSEGKKRGLSYNDIARMTSWAAARRFGLHSKGDIEEGLDADVAAGRSRRDLDRARRGVGIAAGLHAVRGAGAPRRARRRRSCAAT